MNSITATEAKKIGKLMDRVVQSGEPIAIRRNGRPQAVVIAWRRWNPLLYLTKIELGMPKDEARQEILTSGEERSRATARSETAGDPI